MESQQKIISLVVACDDHYLILLAALIRSIEANLSREVLIDLWVIGDNIPDENWKRFIGCIDINKTTVQHVKFSDLVAKQSIPLDRSSYPSNIYARLLIPSFIPAHYRKILYLDVDMLVLADLWELWNMDITDHYLAAVQDPRIKTLDNHWGGVRNFRVLGLNGQAAYFNTGLLLINLEKWRAYGVGENVFKEISANIRYARYPDQYGLNIVCAEKWLQLAPTWNWFADTEKEDVNIIHFIGRKPNYSTYKYSKRYRDIFFSYLAGTPWQYEPLQNEYNRVLKKMNNMLTKFGWRRDTR